ncbi:MAG TPA: hypothetical protein VJT09_05610 [Pyrinomonadaceae bacterium]|nr:hypothetical protein [Pyrinomonadaceae bacterium]
MRPFRTKERERAIKRGLEFIYLMAQDEELFDVWGHDLLNCFCFISRTALDPALRRAARKVGRERGRRWREKYPSLPRAMDAGTLYEHIHATYALDRLGLRDAALKEQLRHAGRRVTVRDFFYFDPKTEPPPADATEPCEGCGLLNERGRRTCRQCRRRLEVINRYRLWYDALIATYNCERVGLLVGARYVDVLKWLPVMRPYCGRDGDDNADFYDCLYAVSHVVYTLNDYSLYRLKPGWLPQEYEFLKANMQGAIETEDPDMMGEFLDSLKAFGLLDSHPLIRTGMDFLLSRQNADGSWGDVDAEDVYERYHPTWTAIDGLRDYAWRGERLSFPRLMPKLLAMNRQSQG